jgi:integrase/recombinase XerC
MPKPQLPPASQTALARARVAREEPERAVAPLDGPAAPDAPTPARAAHVAEGRATALVADFLAARRPGTLRGYTGSLQAFTAFVGAPSVADAARALLCSTAGDAQRLALAWRNHLIESGLAPLTVNSRLAALRALVALARLQGLVSWQIEVRGVRAEVMRDTRGPGRGGVRALLEQVEAASTPKGLRDRAIVRLLTDLALRRAEVCSLDVADVDLVAGTVAVLGKGRTGRTALTLPEPTRTALTAWIAARGSAPGPLFTSFDRKGTKTRLTGTSLARIVRALGAAAGIADLHPHALRHSAITEALDLSRGNIRDVQRFSRHADARTLLVYDDARQDKAGEIAKLVAAWR